MDVRPADERDFEGIAEVRLSNGAAHDDSGVSAEYCRHLVEHERLWVAVESGRVLGYGGAVKVGDARLLSDLFVHAAAHGRGVGGAVLAEVLRGADHMFTFATDAPAAVPLYMRAGMVPLHPVITVEGDAQRVAGAVDHRYLRVIDIDVADAVAFERDVTAIDRRHTYEYWSRRSRSRAIAVTDGGETRAVGAMRIGEGWVRIEHLAVAAHAAVAPAIAAVAADAGSVSLTLTMRGDLEPARLLVELGYRVTDLAQYMASSPSLLPERVAVLHSGFG